MRSLLSAVLLCAAAVTAALLPSQTGEADAGLFGRIAARREARGAAVWFPRLRAAASGCSDCSSSAFRLANDCAECSTPEAMAAQVAADQRNNARRIIARADADRLDSLLGHRAGRGPFAKALNASQSQQSRIVDRFNETVGAKHGFQAVNIGEILQWLVDHRQEVIDVVMLIIQIIGLF